LRTYGSSKRNAPVTLNARVTVGAASYTSLPGWLAVIVHVPAPFNITREPATLHTPCALNVTANPEEAVALTVNACVFRARFSKGAKLIVWLRLTMSKFKKGDERPSARGATTCTLAAPTLVNRRVGI
jgi:hypothetical protein